MLDLALIGNIRKAPAPVKHSWHFLRLHLMLLTSGHIDTDLIRILNGQVLQAPEVELSEEHFLFVRSCKLRHDRCFVSKEVYHFLKCFPVAVHKILISQFGEIFQSRL